MPVWRRFFSVEEAKAYLNKIRNEFSDATHHVSAFIIGEGNSVISHCNDDGEPSGTAGRPALAVLSGSGLGDVVVVVVRYFGGIKLGTGGLVRAYGDAVKSVLAILPKAQKILVHQIMIVLHYKFYEQANLILEKYKAAITDTVFSADVTITAKLPVEQYDLLKQDLNNLTSGSVQIEIIENSITALLRS